MSTPWAIKAVLVIGIIMILIGFMIGYCHGAPPQAPCLPQAPPMIEDPEYWWILGRPIKPSPSTSPSRVKVCPCSRECACGCNDGQECDCSSSSRGLTSSPQPRGQYDIPSNQQYLTPIYSTPQYSGYGNQGTRGIFSRAQGSSRGSSCSTGG